MSSIRQILKLIETSLATLEETCASTGLQIPDLNSPFTPSSEEFRTVPEAALAANIASAAALQLAAILTPPHVSLYHVVGGHYRSAAARVCLESHVTEILREAGPQGLHVNDIAAMNGQDPGKLGRFLRFLAVNHVYREVSPDVFANTRISSMLDTLKPSADVISDPENKFDGARVGLPSHLGHHLDEAFKASAYVWETLSDPQTGHSGEPTATPFRRAFGTKDTVWQFFARPEEKYRQRRFDAGMQSIQALQPAEAIFDAYDWKDLAPDSIVVDVGGGVGASAFPLAREFPALRLVVQDRANVIEDAKKLWKTKMPEAVDTGRVQFEVHDFFEAQPKRDVSIFLLKRILHDWSDEYAAKILRRLREAATTKTKLILVDTIISYACRQPYSENDERVPGAMPIEAPEPLLANFGAVSEIAFHIDMAMLALYNGQDRTFHHLQCLLRQCGWALTMVHRDRRDNTFLQGMEAVPI
ncbi:S-adenosyl-L-methionine-dependent methyltransferase [Dentipellis sp. KUC8613]|nr:S-adenosyl-L-methionine-dependent methyltransferase [Dentipellis sp. KUC8613]